MASQLQEPLDSFTQDVTLRICFTTMLCTCCRCAVCLWGPPRWWSRWYTWSYLWDSKIYKQLSHPLQGEPYLQYFYADQVSFAVKCRGQNRREPHLSNEHNRHPRWVNFCFYGLEIDWSFPSCCECKRTFDFHSLSKLLIIILTELSGRLVGQLCEFILNICLSPRKRLAFTGGSNVTLSGSTDPSWGWIDGHGQQACIPDHSSSRNFWTEHRTKWYSEGRFQLTWK